ncbi:MAG: hypothetical protein BGO01_04310 [Armatimonadetes bacterium 55-13]|nr:MAG: hypothetical protein BGO01_04310 [Armatimonadetes bacterium 55-13]
MLRRFWRSERTWEEATWSGSLYGFEETGDSDKERLDFAQFFLESSDLIVGGHWERHLLLSIQDFEKEIQPIPIHIVSRYVKTHDPPVAKSPQIEAPNFHLNFSVSKALLIALFTDDEAVILLH